MKNFWTLKVDNYENIQTMNADRSSKQTDHENRKTQMTDIP